jgi:heptosyltransferase-3
MSCKTILVIRPGALGDTILTLPVLDSIQAQHPDAIVTFLGNRSYRDLIPPHIHFEAFDDRAWLWMFDSEEANHAARKNHFDRAYVILNRPDDVVRNLERAGVETVHSCASLPEAGRHVVEHLHDALGLAVPERQPCLTRLVGETGSEIIWVHPGSGGRAKCAPPAPLIALVTELSRVTGWKPVITVGEEDAFLQELPGWKQTVESEKMTLMENRPLLELCHELGRSRVFLGNDSGISHLAANLGIPSVVSFAITDPAQWAPWVPWDQMRIADLRGENLSKLDIGKELERIIRLVKMKVA